MYFVKSNSNLEAKILQKYDLCEYCAGRIFSKIVGKKSSKFLGRKFLKNFGKKPDKKCYICKNIFENFDTMASNILEKSSDFDFKTYRIGIILKPSFLERDDYLKSKFKIKGIENLKFGIAKELSKLISRKTDSKRINDNPDLFIQANFKDESCALRAKPLIVYGRYNKKIRNLSQKQEICRKCYGIGCHSCNFKGTENLDSIESIIANFFKSKFHCNQVKINWIGGEDQSSLVLGNGRPFFAKLLNPKKRNYRLPKTFDFQIISLLDLQKLSTQPKGSIPFKSKVQISIKTENPISQITLRKLKNLKNIDIIDSAQGKKTFQKKIYKINYKKTGQKSFLLDLFADGGLPIKSFIQNSNISPNVSQVLENSCECQKLDFKSVIV